MTAPSPDLDLQIRREESVSHELVAAMARLIPQLSSSSPPPARDELEQILAAGSAVLFTARAGAEIVGTLTLVLFRIPTGVRSIIEDVVVDAAARGRGAGEALVREALTVAAAAGAKTVDLTSRPSREAANRLYERIGFERRQTNVYRYDLA
jgi:ribosomal protein S18 acetylase RimI-like enzyme